MVHLTVGGGISHFSPLLTIDLWNVQQQLLCMRMLSKSLTGEEIAHDLIQVLSVNYSISLEHLFAAMQTELL